MSGPVTAEVKATLVALTAAAIFGAGWLVEGWRMERELSDLKRHYAEQTAAAINQNAIELEQANERAGRIQVRLATEENALQLATEEKTHALRLATTGRPCLAEPAVRLLNGGVAARLVHRPVPQTAGEPLPAAAAFATDTDVGTWIAGAQRAYDTCRGRLQAINDFYQREETRVTDVFDRAQEREEEMRQDALAEQARRAGDPAGRVSAEECRMCGEPIPEGRRQAVPGVETCIECQRDVERMGLWDWGMSE